MPSVVLSSVIYGALYDLHRKIGQRGWHGVGMTENRITVPKMGISGSLRRYQSHFKSLFSLGVAWVS